MEEIITSASNPRIKNLKQLIEKSSARREQNIIVIEGEKEISLAQKSGFFIRTLFVFEELTRKRFSSLIKSVKHKVFISRQVFEKVAYRENSDGLIALAEPKQFRLSNIKLSAQPLLIILESVEKPGNLGAILRTADAADADAVIICDPKTDLYNPNIIRSSIGCVFTRQVIAVSSDEVIKFLKEKKIKSFAATPGAKQFFTDVNFREPSAIIFGTEAEGLSQKWFSSADEQVKIPMKGKIDSLNVSVSAAIIIYEALRQRTIP